LREVERARAFGEATVPTTIALERATNPFMRAESAQELAEGARRRIISRLRAPEGVSGVSVDGGVMKKIMTLSLVA
jgi:hypothetical protein